MRFQHHPDGVITINSFAYALEEFQIDEPDYVLPDGYIGREYVPGDRHVLFTNNRADPQPLAWPEGDGYIAKVELYQKRQVDVQTVADETALVAMTYIDKRRAEYPSVEDQLAALWAGGETAAAMKAQLEAIDAKYPPPTE